MSSERPARRRGGLERLKESLDLLLSQKRSFPLIENDPVEFPHRYTRPRDIEVVGFISALLAYGQVPLFKRVIGRILEPMGDSPAEFCAQADPAELRERFGPLYYRMNTGRDLACLLHFIGEVLRRYGSLGELFVAVSREEEEDIAPALSRFVDCLLMMDPSPIYGRRHYPNGLLQLFSSPERRSACKRLNLFLRWMVRPDDGVDFGLWKGIPPSKLIIPLDTHIVRISRYLGLTRRKSPGWAMAREITERFKGIDQTDPLKYDFALCHLGISGACPLETDAAKCRICPLLPDCRRGRGLLGRRPQADAGPRPLATPPIAGRPTVRAPAGSPGAPR